MNDLFMPCLIIFAWHFQKASSVGSPPSTEKGQRGEYTEGRENEVTPGNQEENCSRDNSESCSGKYCA